MNILIKKKPKEITEEMKNAMIDEILQTAFCARSYHEIGVDVLTILLQYEVAEWDTDDKMRFKTELAELLQEHHITPKQLSDLIGVGPNTVHGWLNYDGRMPGFESVIKICSVLGTTVGEFFKEVYEK